MNLLRNKTAIITGASGLIGKNIVRQFAENGCRIIASMRTQNQSTEILFKEWASSYNVTIDIFYFDLTDFESIKVFIKEVKRKYGSIDILINNAGFAEDTLLSLTNVEHLEKMMNVNFYGTFELTKYVLKLMRKAESPAIVNVSSIASLDTYPGMFGYSVSKKALNELTTRIALENNNVRCNAVAPGFIKTDMLEDAITNQTFLNEVIQNSCMKRLGKPEEIANVILFLASHLSSFMTGQVIRADGGNYRGL